jgi:hypothetical protein
MHGGEIADFAADVVLKVLIRCGYVEVKSRHEQHSRCIDEAHRVHESSHTKCGECGAYPV